jgi:hypothetical protein
MIEAATLHRLAALNLPPEAMGEVLSIVAGLAEQMAELQQKEEARKEENKNRKRRSRDGHATRDVTVTPKVSPSPIPLLSPLTPHITPLPPSPSKIVRVKKPESEFTSALLASLFEEFWKVYPRRVEKAAAKKAWLLKVAGGAKPEDIFNGAKRYADYCRREGNDPKFVKHPHRWIRDERWNDDLPVLKSTVVAGPWKEFKPEEPRVKRTAEEQAKIEAQLQSVKGITRNVVRSLTDCRRDKANVDGHLADAVFGNPDDPYHGA